MTQARNEGLDIMVVPLGNNSSPECRKSYGATVLEALRPLNVKGLAFGDLHLRDLRNWREETFSGTYPCRFPIFNVPYGELLQRLWAETGVTVRVSAVSHEYAHVEKLKVGQVFDAAFVADLPEGMDRMGENGEFHTHVFHDERDSHSAIND